MCIFVIESSTTMNNDRQMSEFLKRGNELLAKIDAKHERDIITQEMHEAQLNMYKELFRRDREAISDSIALAERRWNGMRNFVVAIVCVVLSGGWIAGDAIHDRPTNDDIVDILSKRDCASKSDVARSIEVVVDDVIDIIEMETDLTHEDARKEKIDTKLRASKEITGYKSRSVKKQ